MYTFLTLASPYFVFTFVHFTFKGISVNVFCMFVLLVVSSSFLILVSHKILICILYLSETYKCIYFFFESGRLNGTQVSQLTFAFFFTYTCVVALFGTRLTNHLPYFFMKQFEKCIARFVRRPHVHKF